MLQSILKPVAARLWLYRRWVLWLSFAICAPILFSRIGTPTNQSDLPFNLLAIAFVCAVLVLPHTLATGRALVAVDVARRVANRKALSAKDDEDTDDDGSGDELPPLEEIVDYEIERAFGLLEEATRDAELAERLRRTYVRVWTKTFVMIATLDFLVAATLLVSLGHRPAPHHPRAPARTAMSAKSTSAHVALDLIPLAETTKTLNWHDSWPIKNLSSGVVTLTFKVVLLVDVFFSRVYFGGEAMFASSDCSSSRMRLHVNLTSRSYSVGL